MKCANCAHVMTKSLTRHHYKECGLNNVYLDGVVMWKCRACDESELEIQDNEVLHQVIAKAIAEKKSRLKPEEIRFLRVHLGFSGVDFAKTISVKLETVSRWENDPEHEMSLSNEKFLRMLVLAKMKPFTDYETLQNVTKKSPKSTARMNFATTKTGWESRAA